MKKCWMPAITLAAVLTANGTSIFPMSGGVWYRDTSRKGRPYHHGDQSRVHRSRARARRNTRSAQKMSGSITG